MRRTTDRGKAAPRSNRGEEFRAMQLGVAAREIESLGSLRTKAAGECGAVTQLDAGQTANVNARFVHSGAARPAPVRRRRRGHDRALIRAARRRSLEYTRSA